MYMRRTSIKILKLTTTTQIYAINIYSLGNYSESKQIDIDYTIDIVIKSTSYLICFTLFTSVCSQILLVHLLTSPKFKFKSRIVEIMRKEPLHLMRTNLLYDNLKLEKMCINTLLPPNDD